MTEFLTKSQYARHRGVSPAAVAKAVAAGRLRVYLVKTEAGKIRISSAAMADLEWDSTTSASKAPPRPGMATAPLLPLTGEGDTMSFAAGQAAEKHWRAKQAELDYRLAIGELIDAKEIEARMVDDYSNVRTKLLGLPRKVKSSLPHLTREDITAIDALVREALEDLASGIDVIKELATLQPEEAAQ